MAAVCNYEAPTFEQFLCAAKGVIEQIRAGEKADRKTNLAYARILLGYAGENFVPSGTLNMTAAPTDQEVIQALEPITKSDPKKPAALKIPWELVIPFAVRLFEKWLNRGA